MKKLFFLLPLFFCMQALAKQEYEFLGYIKSNSILDESNINHKYDSINLINPQNIYIYSEDASFQKIKKIQLNYLGSKFEIKYDKSAILYCKDIYSADSMYHYTDVICVVDRIKYVKK